MDLSIIFEIIIFYLFIVAAYRLINRQELRELTIADGIILILTVQLMIEAVFNENQNILLVIIPLIILILLKPLLKFFNNGKQVNNHKIVIVKDGRINFSEITKTKYSLYTLIGELQDRGINKIEDVKMAYIDNGKLIINKHIGPYTLVYNGKIDYQVLSDINKNPNWLLETLKLKDLNLNNIFYSFYIDDKIYVIQKDL